MLLTLQVIGLFFGIWFTTINVGKLSLRQSVKPGNLIVMSAGWTLFITATWLV